MAVVARTVAQIGCGHWGQNLARNFAEIGALAAVSDDDRDTADRIAATHQTVVRGFEEILRDEAITAVSIATPAATHANLALRAIGAGKHVFVEKPLALDPRDAANVVEAADRANRILMVGHLLQYHPIFLELHRLVAGNGLGALRYVYSNRLSLGKFRTEENVLWSFAPHDLSMILTLAAEEPDHVDAQGAAPLNGKIADWCISHLRFPSGLRAHVQVSWLHPFKEHRLVAVGERAMAVFEDSQPEWERRLAIYRHRVDLSGPAPLPVKAEPDYVVVERDEPLRAECRHFVECVRTGARPRTDGREGLRVLAVLDRAETALASALNGGR
jgi:predicted dehydrogenase